MKYVNLNIQSGYSFFASTLKIDDIVSYAVNNKLDSIALTDNSCLFGAMEFVKKCKANNIKPIIGMEVNLLESDGLAYPIILLAKDIYGYQSLCRLTNIVSKGNLNVSIDKTELKKYLKGIILIIPSNRSFLSKIEEDYRKDYLLFFKNLDCNFYLGLERYSSEDDVLLDSIRATASLNKIKTVALNHVRCVSKYDLKYLKLLKAIELNTQISKLEYQEKPYYFKDEAFLNKYFTKEEIEESLKINELIDFDIFELKGSLVSYPVKNNVNPKDYLYALCHKGLEKRLGKKINKIYLDRLDYELGVISKMGYVNYFLVVYDYVRFAKTHNILVGPGRGSAAGSLVSYVLGITNVDPLKYNLLFERFLNPERISMPDIDIDFMDNRRDEVIAYLHSKYGTNKTSHVIAFQTFGARQAFRDTFKAMGLSLVEVDMLAKRLPKDINLDLEGMMKKSPSFDALIKTNEKYKEMMDYALHIEGLPRQTTLHAAGIVISDLKLSETSPVYYPSEEVMATQYDMNHIEDIGLLKMDILGLKNLRIIDSILRKIEFYYNKKIDLSKINMEDEKVYQMISSLQTSGVFQLESAGMKRAIHTLKPTSFDDIVAVLALFRPGPMEFIDVYAKRKHGEEKVTYLDPCLEDILKPTYGIIIYQEQIMQILVKMAGFSLGEADIVRRAISKKVESKLVAIEKDFIAGCIKNNHSEKVAKSVFKQIVKFANYGFNKAHSVSYAFVTYQMAYLKCYYPEIFFAEIFNSLVSSNEVKFASYIQELRYHDIELLPPSINKSMDYFVIEGRKIRYSLRHIQGVTPTLIKELINERNKGLFKDFPSFIARMKQRGLNEVQVLALIMSGALDEFNYSRETLKANIANHFIYADIISNNVEGQLSLNYADNPPPEMVIVNKDSQKELEDEYQVFGFFLSGFPLIYERSRIEEKGFITVSMASSLTEKVKVVVYISNVKVIKTKKGELMAHLKVIDETGEIGMTIFPEEYKKYESILEKGNYIQAVGVVQQKDLPTIIVNSMKIYGFKERM